MRGYGWRLRLGLLAATLLVTTCESFRHDPIRSIPDLSVLPEPKRTHARHRPLPPAPLPPMERGKGGPLAYLHRAERTETGFEIGPLAIIGIAIFGTWHSIFYFPAVLALVVALFVFWMVRCTPQSCGLPPIEEFKNEFPSEGVVDDRERELTAKEIFFK